MNKRSLSYSVSPNNESDNYGIIHQFPSVLVSAYASSIHISYNNATRGPQHVIDPFSPDSWCSNNDPSQWIVINFAHNLFYATNYSVQSVEPGRDGNHAKQWRVDGLKSGEWILIDQVYNSKINGMLSIETRPFSGVGPFSAFRITSTGLNWLSNHYLRFFNIDFFGQFYSDCYNIQELYSLRFACYNPKNIIISSLIFALYSFV